jgi:very-short-patch-repair endonuclease
MTSAPPNPCPKCGRDMGHAPGGAPCALCTLKTRDRSERRAKSSLERSFLMYWQGCEGPKLDAEFHFHPGRKWRFDFAHPATRIAVELEGGVFTSGRHTRPAGFVADCDKYNAAAALGWRVFRLTRAHMTFEALTPIAHAIRIAPRPG